MFQSSKKLQHRWTRLHAKGNRAESTVKRVARVVKQKGGKAVRVGVTVAKTSPVLAVGGTLAGSLLMVACGRVLWPMIFSDFREVSAAEDKAVVEEKGVQVVSVTMDLSENSNAMYHNGSHVNVRLQDNTVVSGYVVGGSEGTVDVQLDSSNSASGVAGGQVLAGVANAQVSAVPFEDEDLAVSVYGSGVARVLHLGEGLHVDANNRDRDVFVVRMTPGLRLQLSAIQKKGVDGRDKMALVGEAITLLVYEGYKQGGSGHSLGLRAWAHGNKSQSRRLKSRVKARIANGAEADSDHLKVTFLQSFAGYAERAIYPVSDAVLSIMEQVLLCMDSDVLVVGGIVLLLSMLMFYSNSYNQFRFEDWYFVVKPGFDHTFQFEEGSGGGCDEPGGCDDDGGMHFELRRKPESMSSDRIFIGEELGKLYSGVGNAFGNALNEWLIYDIDHGR